MDLLNIDIDTRRRATALAAVALEGDPHTRMRDLIDTAVRSYAEALGWGEQPPARGIDTRRGRPFRLTEVASRSSVKAQLAPSTVRLMRSLSRAYDATLAEVYEGAIEHLYDEVFCDAPSDAPVPSAEAPTAVRGGLNYRMAG